MSLYSVFIFFYVFKKQYHSYAILQHYELQETEKCYLLNGLMQSFITNIDCCYFPFAYFIYSLIGATRFYAHYRPTCNNIFGSIQRGSNTAFDIMHFLFRLLLYPLYTGIGFPSRVVSPKWFSKENPNRLVYFFLINIICKGINVFYRQRTWLALHL